MSLNSFPWDAVQAELGEDGFPIYSRAYGATDLQEVYKTFFSNGVFMKYQNAFQVRASSNMMVAVTLGKCHINGVIGYPDPEGDPEELVVIPTANTQPRIDTIVLRWDKAISARNIFVDVVSGTPSPNPVRPNLTRDDEVWELGIADILIKADSQAVEQRYITDTRLETARCGAVAPFMEIDTTSFYAKLEAAINHDLAQVKVQTDKQIQKLNDEIDRVIYLSDKLTGGTPEGCGCYQELQQVKNLLYELLGQQDETKYYVIGKTLYPPADRFSLEDKTITFTDASVEDGVLTLS